MAGSNGHSYSSIDAQDLKARVSLAQVIRDAGIELLPRGKGLFGRCCFHEGDDTPSLSVTEDEGLFQCFSCRAGGDVVTFLRLKEGLTFQQAIQRLQSLAGTAPSTPSPTPRVRRNGHGKQEQPDALPGGASRGGGFHPSPSCAQARLPTSASSAHCVQPQPMA